MKWNPWIVITAALCSLAGLARAAEAQGRVVPPPAPATDNVRAAPGQRYEAGSIQRFFLGSGWRDIWTIPITLPVLHIDTFAGGLVPEREGGHKQSVTLHMVDASGGGWLFRSVDKYPAERLSQKLGGTLAGALIQDQISAYHPAGPLTVPPLLDAVGILHAEPVLYVMPDDARLGEHRERFAGMIGALERKMNEGPGDTPGFAGSRKIKGPENAFDDLEESPVHAYAQREHVRLRLIDVLIADNDRTADNYRFARFPHPDPEYRLPLAADPARPRLGTPSGRCAGGVARDPVHLSEIHDVRTEALATRVLRVQLA